MKGIKRISKSGKEYIDHYKKTGRPHTGRPIGTGGPVKAKTLYNRNVKLCLERDNFTCQICGSRASLNVHHKDNKGHHILRYETNDSLDNLQALCSKCHMQLHFGVLQRNREIVERRKKGETFQSIGDSLGVSRQRVQDIFSKR